MDSSSHSSHSENPADQQVQYLLERISAARDFSPDDYFLTLSEWVEQTRDGCDVAAEAIAASALYRRRIASPAIDDPAAPIAFKDDVPAFARSARLLEYLKQKVGAAAPLEAVCGAIGDAELQAAFTGEVRRRIDAGAGPDFIRAPRRSNDRIETLAHDLLTVLAAQRALGGNAYPLTLRQLARLTRPQATEKQVLDAAARNNIFGKKALLAVRKEIDSPTAFHDDAVKLGESDLLLRFLLRKLRTEHNHLFSVSELAKRITTAKRRAVATAFRTSLQRRIQDDELPEDIGCLWVKGAVRLFFLQDIFPASVSRRLEWPEEETSQPALDEDESEAAVRQRREFENAFDTAFDALNRKGGGHNFVSLVDLRASLDAFDRNRFDAELLRLRVEGRYSLSSTQSRHGIRSVEREAAIQEEGLMLLHVSRRGS